MIGSCRLRTPLIKIKGDDRFSFVLSRPPLTHSFAEGRQIWRHATGEHPVPDTLAPYIFELEGSPAPEEYRPEELDDIDTFIVEMCDSNQIHFDEWVFQNNYFSRNFVQKHAAQLLGWYRKFCKGTAATPEAVDEALGKLAEAGVHDLDRIEPILRRAMLRRVDADAVLSSARALVFDPSRRWIFVSHFTVPGDEGTVMRDRRDLSAAVKKAADELGAEFFDPTRLVAHYGRERVLRGGGTDIYEYDWGFVPVMGRIILNIVRDGTGDALELPDMDAVVEHAGPEDPAPSENRLAEDARRANRVLVKVGRSRLEQHGPEASGLYDHFARLLESGQIVRPRDTKVAAALLTDAPAFDRYYVLKAGMGAIPMLLALGGRVVEAADGNVNRTLAMREALDALAVSKKQVRKLVTVHDKALPPPRSGERSVIIAVGLPGSLDTETLLQEVAGHDAVIFEQQSPLSGKMLAQLGLTESVALDGKLLLATRAARTSPAAH